MQDLDDKGCDLEDGLCIATSVVADSFCVAEPLELIVKKKYNKFFTVQRHELLDNKSNLLLQVDGGTLKLDKKRVMRDSCGSVILTMRQNMKLLTLRHWWRVHRSKSSDQQNLIFLVQRSHPLEIKPRLDVFISSHHIVDPHSSPHFQLVNTDYDLSCRVYRGQTVIAEVLILSSSPSSSS